MKKLARHGGEMGKFRKNWLSFISESVARSIRKLADEGAKVINRIPYEGMYSVMKNGATSSAAAVVSALAGLIRSIRPDLSAREVVDIIRKGADDIGEPGYDTYTGFGRVNFEKTVEIALAAES